MILTYLKHSFRLLARNPFFALINIAGLSIGFAVFFVMWQHSQSELASDQQWMNSERIARVALRWEWTEDGQTWEHVTFGRAGSTVASTLADDIPEIESYTRLLLQAEFGDVLTKGLDTRIVASYEKPDQTEVKMYEHSVVAVDQNFFEFFSIPLVSGNPANILKNGNSIVISEATAKKYFGNENAQGKTISLNREPFMVTGVFKDFPSNTHFNFQIAVSNAAWFDAWATRPAFPNFYNYVRMSATANWDELQTKTNSPAVIDKLYGAFVRNVDTGRASHLIQPLHEIPFQKWEKDEFVSKSKTLLYIFQAIGVAVLFLAIINFMSLNAARTLQRLKEIATRKVSGADTRHFAGQFMVESLVTFAIAVGVALTLLQISRQLLKEVLRVPFHEPDSSTMLFFGVVMILSAALTVLYPVYLSWVHQPQMLYQKRQRLRTTQPWWWSLSGLQYTAVMVLIIWGFMIYSQVDFILSKDLGFNRDNVIVIDAPTFKNKNFTRELEGFKNTLTTFPGVQNVTQCTSEMGGSLWDVGLRHPGYDGFIQIETNGGVDENFLPFFNVPLVAGRNLIANDSSREIVISEGVLSRFGFAKPEDAIGALLEIDDANVGFKQVQVVGVFKGYRMRPMLRYSDDHHLKADAGIVLFSNHLLKNWFTEDKIMVRVEEADLAGTINRVGSAFNEVFPGNVFHWTFLDENINRHYVTEKVWRNQILVFTGIAIGIACLGLLGMISNRVLDKTKEIGIRKILGAQIYQIGLVLVSTTARHIAFAVVVGIPLAYYLTQHYLENFSERITIQWWHFVIPIVLLITLMMFTISSMLWNATKSNPVDALKHE